MNPADDTQKPTIPTYGAWEPVPAAEPAHDRQATVEDPKQNTADPKAMKAIATSAGIGGAVLAAIGFTGSYKAVRDLAIRKGFGWFSNVFPIGVDAGIFVLLALDLFLTYKRMTFAPLRYVAWALTGATIAFNAAAGGTSITKDPVGASMHAVIPVLFIIATEAARHYVGRVADITADRHIENPPLIRWFVDPYGTFRIWRRQRLWSLRAYEDVIAIAREAATYRVELRGKYGRGWRRKATVAELKPLRLAKFGTPVSATLANQAAELAALNRPANLVPNPAAEGSKPTPEPLGEPVREPTPEPAEPVREPAANHGSEPAEPAVQNQPESKVRKRREPANQPRRTSPKRTSRTGSRTSSDQPNRSVREPAEPTETPSPTEQVRQILNLITEHGYDTVNLGFVMDQTGMKKTTAYNRLVEARATWSEDHG